MKVALGLLFLASAALAQQTRVGNYENLQDVLNDDDCEFVSVDGVTAPLYWLMENPDTISNLRTSCQLDTPTSRLAVLDSYAKVSCLVKYINDEVGSVDVTRNWVFGLATTTEGVWEWQQTQGGESTAPEFQNWGPGMPDGDEGDDCAYMTVGRDYHLSGFWDDIDCSTAQFYGICEQYTV